MCAGIGARAKIGLKGAGVGARFWRMKYIVLPVVLVGLSGCASPSLQGIFSTNAPEFAPTVEVSAPAPVIETLDPTPPPPPPANANTVAEFDTTTAQDRAEALAAPEPAGETSLGKTLASLGSPSDPGIWLKTPLVDALTAGRIDYNGRSLNIELRPSGGEIGSGSQISLPAMGLLNASLTDIIELTVYSE